MKSNTNLKQQKASAEVLIVEDQQDWRNHFFNALSGQGYGVTKASNVQDARLYLQRIQPDVVILDMHLGNAQGWTLLDETKMPPFGPQIIVVTGMPGIFNDPKQIMRLMSKRDFEGFEVFHFLQKSEFNPQLLRTIVRRALDVAEDSMKGIPALPLTLKDFHEVNSILTKKKFEALTERESEVLKRLILGDSNPEIAIVLSLANETIKTHVKSILTKFQLDGRGKILPFVIKMGLIK
ncbi:MAG TPA: response regulator transcription factor [Anaerolineales bacterium]|nr:response regulator transcription factor [Anaerolineales bacterium]